GDKDDLLLPLRTPLHPLQGQGLVSRQGAQRLSVRHLSYCLRDDHGAADLTALRRQTHQRLETVERGPANSRGRPARSPGETRHADDGWCADRRLGFDLDVVVVETLERLRLDGDDRDIALRRHWFRRRLLEDGEAAKPGTDRPAEVTRAAAGGGMCLGRAFHVSQVSGRDGLFLEYQYSVFQNDRRAFWEKLYRSLFISDSDRGGVIGIFERGEPDGWFGRAGDQH